MGRFALSLAATVVLALGAYLYWHEPPQAPLAASPATPPSATEAPAPEARPASGAVPASLPVAVAPEAPIPLPDSVEIDPERLAMIEADAELRERARQQVLAEAADARWHEAVDGAGYQADDFDPAVRSLFRNISLQPHYAEGGRIEGLVIQDMVGDHPLAEQGFRPGDRLDRIQGVALRDPAEIPALLAHLGPRFEVCAVRPDAAGELCREVDLAE